jgi:hypothetical protein
MEMKFYARGKPLQVADQLVNMLIAVSSTILAIIRSGTGYREV